MYFSHITGIMSEKCLGMISQNKAWKVEKTVARILKMAKIPGWRR